MFKHFELSSGGKVLAVVFTKRHKSDETSLDGLAKENGFLLSVVLKCTLCNRLAPGLSIVADKDSIAFDVAIVAILSWQIGETLDGFRLSTVKVNPMRTSSIPQIRRKSL